MIVWSDGESTIEHRAKCPCKYCIIDRARFGGMMRKLELWKGEKYKSGKWDGISNGKSHFDRDDE